MSILLIKHHDECIYNLKKSRAIVHKKHPPYVSCHHDEVKAEYKKKIREKEHATMGVPEEVPPDPCNFLKKKSGRLCYTTKAPDAIGKRTLNKDKVPTVAECKEKFNLLRKDKNFICENIKCVKKMKPKEPVPKVVIDRFGDSKPLARGMEPIYIKSSVFGRKPEYISNIIKRREKEYVDQKEAILTEQQPICRYISQEERAELLKGLKTNWDELQRQFQLLPILTDTIPKQNKKTKLEQDLKNLERDIAEIEKHPYIYVYDDENSTSDR